MMEWLIVLVLVIVAAGLLVKWYWDETSPVVKPSLSDRIRRASGG